jgi:hypothetical protein
MKNRLGLIIPMRLMKRLLPSLLALLVSSAALAASGRVGSQGASVTTGAGGGMKAGRAQAQAAAALNSSWMLPARYGLFMHYQYRILLGYGGGGPYGTEPDPTTLSITQFNGFVNGFDVNGFANQMAAGGVGWVIFGVDDALFGYCASPNATLDAITGSHPHTSSRDLIAELAPALHARGIKLIVYFAGLYNWNWDPTVYVPLGSDGNVDHPQTSASRQKRLNILAEYANRWGKNVDGWFLDEWRPGNFDASNPLGAHPDLTDVGNVLRSSSANPNAVITFSENQPEDNVAPGIEDYAPGDTYTHLVLPNYTPNTLPGAPGQQWHLKMFCGNVYHGLGDSNYYSDADLINWVTTVNSQGGVATMDWPFIPQTGLLKDFGIAQLQRVGQGIRATPPPPPPPPVPNLASGILPTASAAPSPLDGTNSLATITDGDVNTANYVRLSGSGPQWIAIDLGNTYSINDLKFWHYFGDGRTYHAVVAQTFDERELFQRRDDGL